MFFPLSGLHPFIVLIAYLFMVHPVTEISATPLPDGWRQLNLSLADIIECDRRARHLANAAAVVFGLTTIAILGFSAERLKHLERYTRTNPFLFIEVYGPLLAILLSVLIFLPLLKRAGTVRELIRTGVPVECYHVRDTGVQETSDSPMSGYGTYVYLYEGRFWRLDTKIHSENGLSSRSTTLKHEEVIGRRADKIVDKDLDPEERAQAMEILRQRPRFTAVLDPSNPSKAVIVESFVQPRDVYNTLLSPRTSGMLRRAFMVYAVFVMLVLARSFVVMVQHSGPFPLGALKWRLGLAKSHALYDPSDPVIWEGITNGQTILEIAARKGDRAMVLDLQDKGFDIQDRASGEKPLLHTVIGTKDGLEMARFLIEQGADPRQNGRINDAIGETLLMVVVDDAAKYSETPIDPALSRAEQARLAELEREKSLKRAQYIDFVRFLVERGVDVNGRDRKGDTALKRAHRHAVYLAETLVELGAEQH